MSQRQLGPRISEEERKKARERERERQREQQDEQAARSVATGAATQQGTAAPGYWDMLADPDIGDPGWADELEAFVKAELSRAFALGNITRKEYKDLQLRIESKFWQVQNEMRGEGSGLADDDMRLLYGEERPDLTDAKARRLRGARDVAQMLPSLSVDARGLRSGTEIHAVARTEDGESGGEDEGGLFGGLGSYLGR
jgi:hypothetical protein